MKSKTRMIEPLEKTIFKGYQIDTVLPFQIVQAPFRKFSKYERDGHWNQKEKLKYTVFLIYFKDLLEDPERKKYTRIYEMMADMIITRNPNQCRSHHQKMEKYRVTIPQIILSVSEKIEPSRFKEIELKYTGLIKTLLQNADKYIRDHVPVKTRKNKLKEGVVLKSRSSKDAQVRGKSVPLILKDSLVKEEEVEAVPKKGLKSTGYCYSDYEGVAEEKRIQVLQDFGSILKQEGDDNGGIYHSVDNCQNLQHKQIGDQIVEPSLSQPASNAFFFPISMNPVQDGKAFYLQQLRRLEFQKEWHVRNAEHLMIQYNQQIELIKMCEDKIGEMRLSVAYEEG